MRNPPGDGRAREMRARGEGGFLFLFLFSEKARVALCILCCQFDGVIPFGCGDGDGTLASDSVGYESLCCV